MPWNDNANPGPWGQPSGDGDRRDPPRRPQGGGGRGPQGPNFNAGLEQLSQRLRNVFGGPGGGLKPSALIAVAGGLVGFWLLSGFYLVQPSERGVVTTFGDYRGVQTSPGLNYHLPFPVERVQKVSVASLNRLDIGGTRAGEAPQQSLMITGDQDIIDLDFSVTWRVADPAKYLFATRNPEEAVTAVAESAMREIVGKTPLNDIQTTGRLRVQQRTAELMQRTLDSWGAGVSVVEVQVRSADPPAQVVAAFRDVTRASQDAEAARNQATSYRNRVVNEAKGDAAKIIQAAEAYRSQAELEAQGEAARFNQLYAEYRRAPGVTRDRMYIETMQRVLTNSNKVVVDAKGASAPIILPPDAFRPKVDAAPPTPPQGQPPAARTGQ